MELMKALENRRSIRNFTAEPVDNKHLEEMVRSASLAPSIANSQPWKFVAIKNQGLLDEMRTKVEAKLHELFPDEEMEELKNKKHAVIHFSTFFSEAPAVVAVYSKPYKSVSDKLVEKVGTSSDSMNVIRNYPNIQSLGASIQNFLLAAEDLGYGACWLSSLLVAKDELEELLKVEEPYSLAAFIAVGKPDEVAKNKEKKELAEIFQVIE